MISQSKICFQILEGGASTTRENKIFKMKVEPQEGVKML